MVVVGIEISTVGAITSKSITPTYEVDVSRSTQVCPDGR